MFVAPAYHPQIQHGGDQKPEYIGALHRHALVEHPGVHQRRQRQKDEAENQEQKIVMIRARQIPREEEQQREHQSRGQQN
jgi:hypothetical protein